jgi:hypothetical protein
MRSKNPPSLRFATTTIIENSSTMVAKSIDCRTSCVPTMRKATISTAPMIAAPGRSIFIQGNFPSAKTK